MANLEFRQLMASIFHEDILVLISNLAYSGYTNFDQSFRPTSVYPKYSVKRYIIIQTYC